MREINVTIQLDWIHMGVGVPMIVVIVTPKAF